MVTTLTGAQKEVKIQKALGKKVGLITGCFDILHFGHIGLFRLAKKQVDYLVIGIDNDKTIFLTKGKDRPVNSVRSRIAIVSECRSVDATFRINRVVDYRDNHAADLVYRKVLQKIKPDYLITCPNADKYWKEKEIRTKKLKVKFLPLQNKRGVSSTRLINKKKML
ncbi:MAG: adenylyltransferase/cytidyltransferase family protein [Patescibacteria group bacterium]